MAVAQLGPAEWIRQQLAAGRDEAMEARLVNFKTLSMSVDEAYRAYPPLQKRAKAEGIAKEDIKQIAFMYRDELPRQVVLEATQARLLRAASSRRARGGSSKRCWSISGSTTSTCRRKRGGRGGW